MVTRHTSRRHVDRPFELVTRADLAEKPLCLTRETEWVAAVFVARPMACHSGSRMDTMARRGLHDGAQLRVRRRLVPVVPRHECLPLRFPVLHNLRQLCLLPAGQKEHWEFFFF